MRPFSVYIHVPFCRARCAYCSFVSSIYSESRAEEYFKRLNNEIESFDFSPFSVKTIYFGGGTPSAVDASFISGIVSLIKRKSGSNPEEITVECNPESFSREKSEVYSACGVNRLSFGVQSLSDVLLKTIGRIHSSDGFFKAYDIAKEYFDNISVDLMTGLPGQTVDDAVYSAELVSDLASVKHISVYGLSVEKGTPLFSYGYRVNEDLAADMYDAVFDVLDGMDYSWYEVSNFARPGFESKHNSVYWSRGEYKGFGAAAHSFTDNFRIENTPVIDDYIRGKGEISSKFIDPSGKEALEEEVMLGLRTKKGIDAGKLSERFGFDYMREKKAEIDALTDFLEVDGNVIRLRKKGLYIMNQIILRLI